MTCVGSAPEPPTTMNSSHPNFPVGLAIAPNSQPTGDDLEAYKQREAIEQYGIAGRIWRVLGVPHANCCSD